ncbi:MAG TPA: ROK family transcriptional regulator [Pyrinomonadaceae bacterium]|jgi:predicted NBD/HSP70 family sugar kinase|nr:ROK family transcriptional regulator [Pyrinomonadaceae bacterium]
MRKINPRDFHIATRTTSREINRRIALNLIREHQPISRADLARRMDITRGVVSVLVQELIEQGLIYEGATGDAARGRKPTFLHIRTQDRLAIAVDVRFSKTYLMLCDFSGRQLALEIYDTVFSIPEFIKDLAARVRRMLKIHGAKANCEGIGVAVPGMVDIRTGRILNAPTLGWREVDIRDGLAAATTLPVQIENSGRACALAHLWLERGEEIVTQSFVYVSVSDGVGVGVVVNGELVRGHHHIAGEFGHMPLSLDGPRCMCGATGCWEAYISNLATLSRYFGRNLSKFSPKSPRDASQSNFTVLDLIALARGGDAKAIAAVQSTARFLGLGLAAVVNIINPGSIYLAGEIITAWDLIESSVREALGERALTEAAARTPLHIASVQDHPRLRGAAALIAAPTFAAPRVA